ncbi:MAG: CDP-alcohol phosphatidyltransferase family protein [Acidobacteriota bacterium]|nr:CDP-alcohol phosphatidyltransferase family protein [Acidobacteriota bacterium]
MATYNWSEIKAWGVHVFTASGILAGFMAVVAITNRDWRTAMAWLLAALLIDGIDGTLARRFKVKEVLPTVNGKLIDTVVDFTNYAVVPSYFVFVTELAGVWSLPAALLILLVSAVYYGLEGMVSDDFYFVGFPVMWNVFVFYLVFVFSLSELGNAILIVVFAALHFVPVKFAYPSRATRFKLPTLIATATILILMPLIVWLYPATPYFLKWLAIINLAYFGFLAVFDTFRTTEGDKSIHEEPKDH